MLGTMAIPNLEHCVAIIPCFNAGGGVLPVAEGVLKEMPRLIVVDDGSTDGCIAPLRALPLQVEAMPQNLGKGHALLVGIRAALVDPQVAWIVLLDADGQHDPREIPALFGAAQAQQADLLIGARVFTGQSVPWRSRFGNTITVSVTALLLGRRLPDTQCGYRVLSRRYAEVVAREVGPGRYETEMEIIVKAIREGYTVGDHPIQTLYETGNRSSHFHKVRDSVLIYSRLLRTVLRRRRPPLSA